MSYDTLNTTKCARSCPESVRGCLQRLLGNVIGLESSVKVISVAPISVKNLRFYCSLGKRFGKEDTTNIPIINEVVGPLETLSQPLQRQILEFVRSLVRAEVQGASELQLLRFADSLPADDLQLISEAIEQIVNRTLSMSDRCCLNVKNDGFHVHLCCVSDASQEIRIQS